MKLFLVSIAIVFGIASSASADEAPKFTPEQQDRLVINEMLSNPGDSKPYEFAALAFAAKNAAAAYDRDPNLPYSQWNPVSPQAAVANFLELKMTKERFIEISVLKQQDAIEGFTLKGTYGEAAFTAALGLATMNAGGVGVAISPFLTKAGFDALDISPQNPRLPDVMATSAMVWAFEEVRAGTSTGKMLAVYLAKDRIPDPKADRADHPGVKRGEMIMRQVQTAKDVKSLIEGNTDIKRGLAAMEAALKERNEQTEARAAAGDTDFVPPKVDVTAGEVFHDVGDGLTGLSYILTLTNNPKEAEMVDKLAKASKAMEMLSTAQTMGPVACANVYLFAAVMIYSAIKTAKAPESPYPAIFAMLARISKQIEDMRFELGTRLNQIDTKLSGFIQQTLARLNASLDNQAQITQLLAGLQQQLNMISVTIQGQMLSLVDIAFAEQDRNCFLPAGGGDYLRLEKNTFITCVNTYLDRGTIHARSVLASTPLGSVATSDVYGAKFFPYSDYYEQLRKAVDPDGIEYTRSLAHPAVWYQSATLLAKLLRLQPEFISVLDVNKEQFGLVTLRSDELVRAGQELKTFRETLLLTYDNGKPTLRGDRIRHFLNRITDLYGEVVQKIQTEVARQETPVDAVKEFSQPFNRDYPYSMFAQSVPFCLDKTATLTNWKTYLRNAGPYVVDISYEKGNWGAEGDYEGARNSVTEKLRKSATTTDPNRLAWDRQILNAMAKELPLIEQSGHRAAYISACIQTLEISNLDQVGGYPAKIDVRLALHLDVVFDTATGKVSKPAQDIEAAVSVTVPYGGGLEVYSGHSTFRIDDMVAFGWNETIYPALIKAGFKDVSSQDTKKSFDELKAVWHDELFSKHQATMKSALDAQLAATYERFVSDLKNLEALLSIGLDENLASVQKVKKVIDEIFKESSPESLVKRAVIGGEDITNMAAKLNQDVESVRAAVTTLTSDPNLQPAPDLLLFAEKELDMLYWMRAAPSEPAK